MKAHLSLPSQRTRILGILLLSGIALFSSLYLQYVAGYEPCIYCYVLRYLTVGILMLSISAIVAPSVTSDISAALIGLGLVGTGLSGYLILDETFPSAGICTACSITPVIFGVSLYYYSIIFMAIVLGISITIFRSD